MFLRQHFWIFRIALKYSDKKCLKSLIFLAQNIFNTNFSLQTTKRALLTTHTAPKLFFLFFFTI